jgi:hypothetical protein
MRIVAVFVLLSLTVALGQEGEATPSFPESWAGTWRGPIRIVNADGRSQEVPMEFAVAPTDDPNRFQWKIRYGDQAVRNYELVAIDREKGRYEVDEKNSIVLPALFLDGELISVFAVSGNRIVARYRKTGDTVRISMLSTTAEAVGATGGEGRVPPVYGFDVRSVQTAEMTRVEQKEK